MKKVRNLLVLCFVMMAACMLHSEDAKAEKVGKYEMSDTSSCSNYDVTGDGMPDTVNFEKLDKLDGDAYQAFKVVINGDCVLYGYNECFFNLEPVFIQTEGHQYFYIALIGFNDVGTKRLYEYVDGQLKLRADLDKYMGKLYYNSSATVSSVKANSITLKVAGQTNMLASTNMSITYKVGATGKLSLSSKVAKVSYSKLRFNGKRTYRSDYLVAKKKIQAYRSATGTKKAFRIKKGTKLKITKVSVQGKTPRYYCVTKSGKKGWVKSKNNLFKDLAYAG